MMAIGRAFAAIAVAIILAASSAPPRAGPTRPPVVLAFGDSLTAGFGLPQSDAFPAQLQRYLATLHAPVRAVNAGVSGDTTADGLARLDWALAAKPTLVILELGANDMLRGIDPKLVRSNLAAMIAKIRATGATMLLAGMKAVPNWGPAYQKSFDSIYPELAQQDHVALYPFFLDGVATDRKLNQPDGLHPNAAGVAIIVRRIAPYVVRLLGDRP